MAIKLKGAKTTATGAASIFSTLSGVSIAFSQIPSDEISEQQLIGFGLITLGTLFNALGNLFAPDSSEVAEVLTEVKPAGKPVGR